MYHIMLPDWTPVDVAGSIEDVYRVTRKHWGNCKLTGTFVLNVYHEGAVVGKVFADLGAMAAEFDRSRANEVC